MLEAAYRFRIESDPLHDILLRVLGPFAMQHAAVTAARHSLAGCVAVTVVEAAGLDDARMALIRRRLAQIPCVRAVSCEALDRQAA